MTNHHTERHELRSASSGLLTGPRNNESKAVKTNDDVAKHRDDKWDDKVRGIGNDTDEQEATTSYGGHHQDGGSCLCERTQSTQCQRENGGEHDGLEKINSQQPNHRILTKVHQDDQSGQDTATTTDKQHHLWTYVTHDETGTKPAHHEEAKSTRKYN